MRVVSLNCSNTEIVCALGCSDMLVGVDDHSDHPAEVVKLLPRVGPDLGIDTGAVQRLQPDLVLASLTVPGHEQVIAALDRAGLPYLAPEPVSLQDVYGDIRVIAEALGVAGRATPVIEAMREQIKPQTPSPNSPRILVEWWPKPVIAPAKYSWVNDLLTAAGAINPLVDLAVKSQALTDQQVLEHNPDAMVISWCGVRPEKYRPDVLYRNPAFSEVAAIRNRQVHCIPEWALGRPSPRLVEGWRQLRRITRRLRAA